MTKDQLKKKILEKKSYFKKGKGWLAEQFGVSVNTVQQVLSELDKERRDYIGVPEEEGIIKKVTRKQAISELLDKIKDKNPNLKAPITAPEVIKNVKSYGKGNPDNVLFIGDLHAPFILDGYLEFNLELQKKYNCGTVVFAGDIIDGHSWSFHSPNVDGLSVGDELAAAKSQLKSWYKAFPEATVLFGNHDLLIVRKAREYGLSQLFLKFFGDVVDAPKTWQFTHELYKDNVLYVHGSVGNAIKRASEIRHSVAQGHLHTQTFVEWAVSEIDAIFGLQVGCGIDRKKYAFEYAADVPKKQIISSGVILDKGHLPLVELMRL